MSDTSNRGRIQFLVMTNRPDKLDVDLKRAGRLDRKIPFVYSKSAEEVEQVARAVSRKNKVRTTVDLTTIREAFATKLIGYSNAGVEAVVLMANDDAAREAGGEASVEPAAAVAQVRSHDARRTRPAAAASARDGGESKVGLRRLPQYNPVQHFQRLGIDGFETYARPFDVQETDRMLG